VHDKFVIILNVNCVLSIDEMESIAAAMESAPKH
jgi:hypothetical protein